MVREVDVAEVIRSGGADGLISSRASGSLLRELTAKLPLAKHREAQLKEQGAECADIRTKRAGPSGTFGSGTIHLGGQAATMHRSEATRCGRHRQRCLEVWRPWTMWRGWRTRRRPWWPSWRLRSRIQKLAFTVSIYHHSRSHLDYPSRRAKA